MIKSRDRYMHIIVYDRFNQNQKRKIKAVKIGKGEKSYMIA